MKRPRFYSLLLICFFSTLVFSQVEEVDPRKKEAEIREAEAKARAAEIDIRTKELANLKSQQELLKSTTTIEKDSNPIQMEIRGYQAVIKGAENLANSVKKYPQIKKLVIYDANSVKLINQYQLLLNHLNTIKNGYERASFLLENKSKACGKNPTEIEVFAIKKSGVAGLLSSIASGNGFTSFLDLLSLFKTETTIRAKDVAIGEDELVAKLAENLKNVEFYYPKNMMPMDIDNAQESPLAKEIIDITTLKSLADQYASQLDKVDSSNSCLMSSTSSFNNDKAYLSRLNAIFENTINELSGTIKTEEGKPALTADGFKLMDYLTAEKLHGIIKNGGHWIQLKAVKSGGNMRNQTSPILDIFRGGGRQSYSGGTIIYFTIYDNKGKILTSDTFTVYVPYKANVNKP